MAGNSFRKKVGVSRLVGLMITSITVAACQPESPTATMPIGDVGMAKGSGGGGGGGGGVAPTITATDPPSSVRDTTIDVTILGSGFTNGAKATWSLAGDTSLVHVKSTKVVASDRIVAQVEVPATAPVGSYDVEVTLTNGKKGVGAEMFEVQLGDPEAAFWFPLDDADLGVRSDHLFVSGTSSVYANGVCGIHATIFATGEASGSGDAVMQTAITRYSDRKCSAYPRTLTVVLGPGDQQTGTANMNVRQIANSTYSMPIGSTDRHGYVITEARCNGLRWVTQRPTGEYLGGDSVNVTRVDASTWLVESQPYPNNKAHCSNDGQLYHVNVRLTVKSDRPLP